MLNSPYGITQFAIGLLGSILTIACFVPQGIKTLKSRDTSGISVVFPISALVSSFFWMTSATMAIVHPVVFNGGNYNLSAALISSLPIIITNLFIAVINFIVAPLKLKNLKTSKKLGISEYEYCQQYKLNKHELPLT